MPSPVLIVGASLAALRSAEALRRNGYAGEVKLIGDETHLPYNRPPLSKAALSTHVDHGELAFALKPELDDVEWVVGTRIASSSLEDRTVTDSEGVVHPYSVLVAATGMRPRRLPPELDGRTGRVALRSLEDAALLRTLLGPGVKVVVAGAGFIGCEVAATARSLGCAVDVVASESHPMRRQLHSALAAELERRHEARGVRFHLNTHVASINGRSRVSSVTLANGSMLPCDVLVEAIGSVPNTEWLQGNDLDLSHGVRTDSAMRAVTSSGEPWADVFAVGDVARFPNTLFGDGSWSVGHWNMPSETARRAGRVIASCLSDVARLEDVVSEGFAPVPSFWSDQFDMHLLAYGMLGLADRAELLHGQIDAECVFGYFRRDSLVGVCGLGLRSIVMSYRNHVGVNAKAFTPDETRRGSRYVGRE